MGAFRRLPPLAAPIIVHEPIHETLLDLRADVQSDGDGTSFSLAFTNQEPFKCHVSFEEMAPILNELRYAANLMMSRQGLKVDRGAQKMMDLVEHALRPSYVEILIDPLNGDRIFILMFHDHAPLGVRLTPEELQRNLANLAQVINRSNH